MNGVFTGDWSVWFNADTRPLYWALVPGTYTASNSWNSCGLSLEEAMEVVCAERKVNSFYGKHTKVIYKIENLRTNQTIII